MLDKVFEDSKDSKYFKSFSATLELLNKGLTAETRSRAQAIFGLWRMAKDVLTRDL